MKVHFLVEFALAAAQLASGQGQEHCPQIIDSLHLGTDPFQNYFIADCHSAGQFLITSPNPDRKFSNVGPRLLFAWPAGNSGLVAKFSPVAGPVGSLGIAALTDNGNPLRPIYEPAVSGPPVVGMRTNVSFNATARLDTAVLGSIRHLRDFVEGGGNLHPEVQEGNRYEKLLDGGAQVTRLWFDGVTTMKLRFTPLDGQQANVKGNEVTLAKGVYTVEASFNYPQLAGLTLSQLLKPEAAHLIAEQPQVVKSVAFLTYQTKLLAGGWRFLTYFGRDSMISALLMQPVLSEGEGGAIEAVIAAVLERVNSDDGSVCHEEAIGDFASWIHRNEGVQSNEPTCDYNMIDPEFYLPILMERYFVQSTVGVARAKAFFATKVSFFAKDQAAGLTYGDMAELVAARIMARTAAFAASPTKENLIHLKDNAGTGQWRDSWNGIGNARIPMDVNTALAPAALRAIAAVAQAGLYPLNNDWSVRATEYAAVWEDKTLPLFDIHLGRDEAKELVKAYVRQSSFAGPDQTDLITEDVSFPALGLDGRDNSPKILVQHSDTAFRLFLVNSTDDAQLSSFLNNTAKSLIRPFPAGLMTDVSMLIANPAYGGDVEWYNGYWNPREYHGTVVWGFQLSMMARGLEMQLARCHDTGVGVPAFCTEPTVLCNVQAAYTKLWDSIDANRAHLNNELWSWRYANGKFEFLDLGALSTTESNIVQLWSLTFLAVTRNAAVTKPANGVSCSL